MKLLASEVCTTSAALTPVSASFMNWAKMRSDPLRFTSACTPYFSVNALASDCATLRSTDVYQTTEPSRRAASTSCGSARSGSLAAAGGFAAGAPALGAAAGAFGAAGGAAPGAQASATQATSRSEIGERIHHLRAPGTTRRM